MDVAIMLEGQNGLNWTRFQRIARAVEELGFAGLYRSDHFTNPQPPDLDSLELWVSLTWLASHTSRIQFGPLVSPVSFRHPVFTARMAKDVDDLSGGRLTLGVGAGWQEREHANFGFDLLDVPARFARFEEGLEVITRLLRSDQPVSFQGDFYRLQDAILLPRPQRPGGPPLLIGGNGRQRTLPLVARYADEWNGVFLTAERYAALNRELDHLLEAQGRRPESVRRSLMTGLFFGRDDRELARVLDGRPADELRAQGRVVGTPQAVVDQLGALAEAGAQRVMLQWLDLDNLDGLEALAQAVL
ncbi:MAG: LLM class F420-dependent oxidoreductase [Litorilinea sp.]|nr:MAG: LLM class F420-dependent oxidoreductase [Litorilinea sp.]